MKNFGKAGVGYFYLRNPPHICPVMFLTIKYKFESRVCTVDNIRLDSIYALFCYYCLKPRFKEWSPTSKMAATLQTAAQGQEGLGRNSGEALAASGLAGHDLRRRGSPRHLGGQTSSRRHRLDRDVQRDATTPQVNVRCILM